MMVYIFVYKRNGKRVRKNRELTPAMEYITQAIKYLSKRLGGSPYINIIKK